MDKKQHKSNRKRRIIAGFCFGIPLVAILAAFSATAEAGCAGDCMTCHENLRNTPEHRSLVTCIQCHKTAEEKSLLPGTVSADGCGTRCFDCHDKWPADGWHADLETCGNCHDAEKK